MRLQCTLKGYDTPLVAIPSSKHQDSLVAVAQNLFDGVDRREHRLVRAPFFIAVLILLLLRNLLVCRVYGQDALAFSVGIGADRLYALACLSNEGTDLDKVFCF